MSRPVWRWLGHPWIRGSVLGVGVALAGCATQPSTQSGFLQDYARLRPTSDGSDAFKSRVAVQAPEPGSLARYDAVYLEPATIVAEGLDADQVVAVSEVLNKALAEEVGRTWPLVERPGRGVLRVRTAVTGVTKSIVPLNLALSAVAVPLSNGGAAGEAEILDGQTGRRVAALTWADEKRLSGPFGYSAETGHARALLPEFAAEIARTISAR